ncbi:Pr6Pr family membrane protein [Actinoplanes sp. LDG1-06]|uniref:Pr6Pr family membrane protein n=1 Tax=Paractinoplanes ovalisporus TaxID=2810368 RepID=A0ABS2AMM3_9ACTN|nr:Pr6Pr family membrane protein [Actinoplanes ovalisporus]MBM2621033.1 Pr6Pr family membrane protein [Actinoplanes ovalisporus]
MSTRVWFTPQFWLRAVIVVAGASGLLLGDHRIVYYTSQSNLITLGYFGGVLYWMVRRGTTAPAAPRLRGAVTLWIVITGLISHFMLQNGENPLPGLVVDSAAEQVTNWSAFLVHYVVPVLVLADWVAFGPRRVSPWRDLWLWILFPLGYGVSSVARAVLFPAVSDRYPYFFLDPTEHGYGWVGGQFVRLAVIFGFLGAVLLGIDRLAARLTSRPPAPAPPAPHAAEADGVASPQKTTA